MSKDYRSRNTASNIFFCDDTNGQPSPLSSPGAIRPDATASTSPTTPHLTGKKYGWHIRSTIFDDTAPDSPNSNSTSVENISGIFGETRISSPGSPRRSGRRVGVPPGGVSSVIFGDDPARLPPPPRTTESPIVPTKEPASPHRTGRRLVAGGSPNNKSSFSFAHYDPSADETALSTATAVTQKAPDSTLTATVAAVALAAEEPAVKEIMAAGTITPSSESVGSILSSPSAPITTNKTDTVAAAKNNDSIFSTSPVFTPPSTPPPQSRYAKTSPHGLRSTLVLGDDGPADPQFTSRGWSSKRPGRRVVAPPGGGNVGQSFAEFAGAPKPSSLEFSEEKRKVGGDGLDPAGVKNVAGVSSGKHRVY